MSRIVLAALAMTVVALVVQVARLTHRARLDDAIEAI